MSRTLYLVQLLPCFRFHYETGTERTLYLGAGAQAFHARDQAEEWLEHNRPTEFNPFEGFYEDEEDFSLLQLWGYSEDNDEEHDEITAGAMNTFLTSLGIVSSLTASKALSAKPWHDWWEATAPSMTKGQKASIWKFLVPMPYRIVEVEME